MNYKKLISAILGHYVFFLVLGLSIAAFLLLKHPIGVFFAIIISIAVFATLALLNQRSSTTGLYRESIKTYFKLRTMGYPHKEAIEGVIYSWHPRSSEKREIIRSMFYQNPEMAEKEMPCDSRTKDVKELTYVIFCFETKTRKSWNYEDLAPIFSKIEKVYNSLQKKYNVEM